MHTQKKTAKRAALSLALVGALFATAGCGGTAESDSEPETETGALTMYTWTGGAARDTWESFVTQAQAEMPDLEVAIEGPSFVDYWTKVKTRLSGDNPPCILTTQAARTQELESLLMPLDDLVAEQGLDVSDFNEAMINGMTVDGTLRAIPYDAEPFVLWYNADAFRAAGLELPTTNYSREQFIADAKALTTENQMGLVVNNKFDSLNAWSIADEVTAVEDNQLTMAEPDFVDQMQSFFELGHVHGIVDAPEASDDATATHNAFLSGEGAMLIEGPWNYGVFADGADFELGMTTVPSTTGDPHAMIAGSGFGIAANCDQPQAAFEAIIAMTSTSVQEQQAAAGGIVPSRIEALPAWSEGKPAEATAVIEALLENSTAQETTPNFNQVSTLYTQYAVQGFRGEQSAAEIAETIQGSASE
ncbi:hypothetical protein GCM10027403_21780 [Arthrobacter tecti]